MSNIAFQAFADDSTVVNIGGDDFTISNDPLRIALSGSLEITRDRAGLVIALALQATINSMVDALRSDPGLPEQIADEPPAPISTVNNPFA